MIRPVLLIAGLLLAPTWLGAAEFRIPAARDATLIEDPRGELASGSGPHLFCGRTAQPSNSLRRALLAFDVAAHLPRGAQIRSARVELHVSQGQAGALALSLYRLAAPWGEGASSAAGGSGVAAQPDDATWLQRFFARAPWRSPGGDFAAEPSASRAVAGPGAYTWASTPQLVADVRGWLDDPGSNHGWILLGDEWAPGTVKRFDSREGFDPAHRPVLIVELGRPQGACDAAPEAARALCHAYCEALDCDAPSPAGSTRACAALAGQYARATGGRSLACQGADADLDGVPDERDRCPRIPDPEQGDADRDGVGDACDNCPLEPNADQADGFGLQRRGDACECPCFGSAEVSALLLALADPARYAPAQCIDTRVGAKPLTALFARRRDGSACAAESADCSALAVEFTEDNLCQLNPVAPEPGVSLQGIGDAQRAACRVDILAAAARDGLSCD